MIQLTQTSYVVLGLVDRAGKATPYDLKQIVAATIGGFFSIPHSQLYAEPERLAKAGYLTESREDTGRRRKHYTLTQRGRDALAEWLAKPTEEMYELRDPGLLKLAFGSDPHELARVQLAGHEARLAELKQLAAALEAGGAPQSQLLVAAAGIGHEREYIRFWKRLAGSS